MRRYSCLHTHSVFCDGVDEIEVLCQKAHEKGLVSLGLSSHAPIYKKTGIRSDWHLQDDRLEEYLDEVRAARQRWAGKLQVFLGLEVDYIKGRIGPRDRDFQELGLDYIIASVHYLIPPNGGGELFTVDGPPEEFERGLREGFSGDGEALMEAYWVALEEMIRSGGFDILGHADIIKKNNSQGQWFSMEGKTYLHRISSIAEAVAAFPTVVELNTGGLNRGKTPDTYPSLPFLGLLKTQNIPVIITADAHQACDLDGNYGEARKALLAAGYTQALLFEGRKDGKPVWSEEPL